MSNFKKTLSQYWEKIQGPLFPLINQVGSFNSYDYKLPKALGKTFPTASKVSPLIDPFLTRSKVLIVSAIKNSWQEARSSLLSLLQCDKIVAFQ